MPRPGKFAAIHPVTDATDVRSAMTPAARLSKRALSVFNLTVARHKHLRPADCVLLTVYAQTAARVLSARADDKQLEKMSRLLIAYGRALCINAMQAKPPKRPGGIGVGWWQNEEEDDDSESLAEQSLNFRAGDDDASDSDDANG